MTEPPLDPESRITPDNSLATATPLLFAHLLSWWGGRVCPCSQTHASVLAAPPAVPSRSGPAKRDHEWAGKVGPLQERRHPRHVWQEQPSETPGQDRPLPDEGSD